jgi:A/G-specific adenine glycosylase
VSDKIFVKNLLKWYKINKRDLPWRNTQNPYYIWLSEVILQQTRVNQGLPYYVKFIEKFPDIQALAKSPEQKVLSLWQGLGYYSRARNLHASAKLLMEKTRGKLPENYKDLLDVKGIGPYTAAAIASFAYKERVPVVDGNVYRVLSRIFGVETDIASSSGIKEFRELAWKIIPEKDHDTYNQAIMEFGALQCVPSNPNCSECPMEEFCFANKHNLQQSLPVKTKSVKKRTRYFNYLLIRYKNNYIMKERKNKDIWQGLFEFPVIETDALQTVDEMLAELNKRKITIENQSKVYKHILSHQTIYAQFSLISVNEQKYFNKLLIDNNSLHFSEKQIKILPKPVLITKFLEDYIFV